MDPQRNASDQAGGGWYDTRHGEPEWEGYLVPGPRGTADSLEPDPLSGGPRAAAQSGYDQQGGYNPLAAPAMEVPAYGPPPSTYGGQPAVPVVPAPAAYEVPGAAQQSTPPPPPGYKSFEEPTGVVPPVTLRSDAEPIETQRFHTESIDRAALRRPPVPPTDGVYRTKRPAAGIVFAVLTVLFEVPALRLLADAAIGGPVVASGVVAGTFLVAGLPLVALGLYALVTGANRLPGDGSGAQALLRTPTAYLPVGLVLLVAAALAA